MSTATTVDPPNTSAVEGKNTDGASSAAATQTATSEAKFTQADIDRIVKDRLTQQKTAIEREQQTARERAEADAAEKKALEDGEFKKVIEAREATIAELQPRAELADALAQFVNETIDAETKDWPDEVRALVPSAEDVRARAAEVGKLRPLAAKLSTGAPPTGLGRAPRPAGGADPAKTADAAKALVAQKRVYSL